MTNAARLSAAAKLPDRIAFFGFGLIGGSLALALREAGSHARLTAWTPGGTGPAEGLRLGLLDAAPATAAETLDGAGLVVLAGPPLAIVAGLGELAGVLHGSLSAGVTITDVASTKAMIAATAEDLGLPFVGGHPMAGREATGVEAATPDLFHDRPWVIVAADGTDQPHLERVEALATAAGARPVRMDGVEHDLAVAAISHLPLIASAALVESVAADAERWPMARGLAASGWRGATRLARGDADMGAGIIATNARPIAGYVRAYRDALDSWLADLDAMTDESQPAVPGPERVSALRARLAAARATLEEEPRP